MFGSNEPLGHGMFDEREQRVKVAVNVQESTRFPVQAELTPRGNLEQFLPRSQTARQCDECIRQARHHGLAVVHGSDHVQFAQPMVCHFLFDECLRNHTNNAPADLERRVGNDTHQADVGSAIYNTDVTRGEQSTELSRGVGIRRSRARTRTCENADVHATVSLGPRLAA